MKFWKALSEVQIEIIFKNTGTSYEQTIEDVEYQRVDAQDEYRLIEGPQKY